MDLSELIEIAEKGDESPVILLIRAIEYATSVACSIALEEGELVEEDPLLD